MVDGGAVGGEQGMEVLVVGRAQIGGVGFDEEAVGGEVLEDGALGGFAVVEEVGVEGEISAAFDESVDHFRRPAVGVEEEAAGGQGMGAEDVPERAPGAEAVDGDGEVALGGEGELGGENFALRLGVVAGDPAVEADLADGCAGVGIELGAEVREPVGRTRGGVPRMQAEGRGDPRLIAGEGGDGGPVVLAGAVDDRAGDAEAGGSPTPGCP